MTTAYHSQYWARALMLRGATGTIEALSRSIAGARVDLNPHQVDAAQTDDGMTLDDETCRKLMLLPAAIEGTVAGPILDPSSIRQTEVQSRLKQVEERNGRFFDEEVLKLDRWSDDLKQGLEREIKELDREIREARKTSALAALLKDKLEAQKTLKSLEGERNRKRRELFDAQDAIDGQRDELIERIEGQLRQRHAVKPVFCFRWRLA